MYNHILIPVAIDHLEHASPAFEVAKRLIKSGGEISLVNVIEDIPTFASSYIPKGTLEANEKHIIKALDKLAHEAGHNYASVVIHGKPHITILEQAEKVGADCIIIASHKPGLEDYFLGSTAGRVVRHAKCCVHVLR